MKPSRKHLSVILLSSTMLLGSLGGSYASAAMIPSSVNPPEAPAWGHFVDTYKNNTKDNKTVSSNPTIGVLSEFNSLWTPGSTWDTGKKLNNAILDANIQKVIDITTHRTASEAEAAYLDDRRNQSYSVMDGLGSLTDVYRKETGATTTIAGVAADATKVKYDDKGNNSGDPKSNLGNMVTLVNTLRGNYSSTSQAKNFFGYPRPFRWSEDVALLPTLVPAKKSDPSEDGGFPSGHTNGAYLASIAMAYAVPERYQELLTRASELGNNRIVTGMHSPLDVMGGRVMATALAAAILNDPDNKSMKEAAYQEAHTKLLTKTGTAVDRFSDYATNKKNYTQRLTYDFPQVGSDTKSMIVPKGAEVLLETRLPYLNDTQRRWVLATTGLPSGYPVLDDPEGWGRLNLFAAADGYGAFVNNVTVNMDSSKGGFNKVDTWRNDISGKGKLTKQGTGTLKLEGNNTYSGGTQIDQGTLEGKSVSAFGKGAVINNRGTLRENVSGKMTIAGNFKQAAKGTLELNVESAKDQLQVKGLATYGGKLRVYFTNKYIPAAGNTITLITSGKSDKKAKFASVQTVGLSKQYKVNVIYNANSVQLKVLKK